MKVTAPISEASPTIVISEESIRQHSSGQITGIIYWQIGDQCFPDSKWDDFIVVIIGWWAEAIVKLMNGDSSSEVLSFMDGPFLLRCTTTTNVVRCEFIDPRLEDSIVQIWLGNLHEIGQTALDVGNNILRICQTRNFYNHDTKLLEKEINHLQLLV